MRERPWLWAVLSAVLAVVVLSPFMVAVLTYRSAAPRPGEPALAHTNPEPEIEAPQPASPQPAPPQPAPQPPVLVQPVDGPADRLRAEQEAARVARENKKREHERLSKEEANRVFALLGPAEQNQARTWFSEHQRGEILSPERLQVLRAMGFDRSLREMHARSALSDKRLPEMEEIIGRKRPSGDADADEARVILFGYLTSPQRTWAVQAAAECKRSGWGGLRPEFKEVLIRAAPEYAKEQIGRSEKLLP